jgi:hypothetical protein
VNQVLEIMLRWLENHDWEKAFMQVIPKRKLPEGQETSRSNSGEARGTGQQMGPQEGEITDLAEGYELDDQFSTGE